MNARGSIGPVLVAMVSLGGCAHSMGAGGSSPESQSSRGVGESYAQVGAPLRVRLNEPLDSSSARPGQTFAATLLSWLRTHDGKMIAAPGAQVLGHVLRSESGDAPVLTLAFDAVETGRGLRDLEARVRDVDRPRRGTSYAITARGGGPSAPILYDPRVYDPRNIVYPAGTELELQLTRPVAP